MITISRHSSGKYYVSLLREEEVVELKKTIMQLVFTYVLLTLPFFQTKD
ncbi:hypothetical protein EH321_RS12820 [Enterococcus hirae]|nr:hypothetical protein [Enterococcus hirae]EMF0604992.1 hypothetical protein [Enterococcus hirae]